MGSHIIHTLLVTSNRFQSLSPVLVAGIIALLSGVVWLITGLRAADAAALAAGTHLLFSLLDWLLLWLLPRLGRSFGPDRPSALALAVVRALVLIVLGLLALPGWLMVITAALISAVAFYATWIEPFRLGVTHETYTFPGWRADAPPLRLLHIGDIHIERITARERRLNALIEELKPDVIVFSGDFVNISYHDDPLTEKHIREIISAWRAPLGVYCVSGTYTVESLERVRTFVAGLDNLRLLVDEWVRLDVPGGAFNLLGMRTTHFVDQDRVTVAALAQRAPDADAFKLLLTHAPDVAPEADAAGYHLYLCGHTHGGQIRFPFIGAVFSGSALGLRFVMGRYDLNTVTVYTSRGVGLEGMGAPRARFLCPPEIILWEIRGAGVG
ncbi:MAG: hypothetical protein OHK0046_09930 [Anaerolineae bacterium]